MAHNTCQSMGRVLCVVRRQCHVLVGKNIGLYDSQWHNNPANI